MRVFIYIIFLVSLAFVLCSADSCSSMEERKEDQKRVEIQSRKHAVEGSFESTEIYEEMREGFEAKAEQMLRDFADYYNILTDKSLDDDFRMTSGRLIQSLFDVDADSAIKDIVGPIDASKYDRVRIQIDSVKLEEELRPSGDGVWRGSFRYKQELTATIESEPDLVRESYRDVGFVAKRVEKQIGQNRDVVWQVYLE